MKQYGGTMVILVLLVVVTVALLCNELGWVLGSKGRTELITEGYLPSADQTWESFSTISVWPEKPTNVNQTTWDEMKDGAELQNGYYINPKIMYAEYAPTWVWD